ncbi:c-type cytochrome [Rhodobacterales bacterium HKCCE3408]|nr:c-type cytochrome [Rhodobacterales bacterium HKCCE3408]
MRIVTLALAACLALPAAAQDAGEGRELFQTYCTACHGIGGRGDGRMAPILTVLPPDLTGLAARNGGDFPVFAVARQIDGRDPMLAHGGDMPIFGRWFEGEATVAMQAPSGQPILLSRPIADVIAYLEGIQE